MKQFALSQIEGREREMEDAICALGGDQVHHVCVGLGGTGIQGYSKKGSAQWWSQDLKVGYSRPSPTKKKVHTSQGKNYGSFQYQTSKK
jgi:hypothetical protein